MPATRKKEGNATIGTHFDKKDWIEALQYPWLLSYNKIYGYNIEQHALGCEGAIEAKLTSKLLGKELSFVFKDCNVAFDHDDSIIEKVCSIPGFPNCVQRDFNIYNYSYRPFILLEGFEKIISKLFYTTKSIYCIAAFNRSDVVETLMVETETETKTETWKKFESKTRDQDLKKFLRPRSRLDEFFETETRLRDPRF